MSAPHASSDDSPPREQIAASDANGVRRRRTDDLIERIREAADKLARDGSARGDLKIISRTMRELRYAFKVFAPYRNRRKVTVFGSARTPPGDPSFQQAVEFGRCMADEQWLVVTGAAAGIMEAGHIGAGRENSMGLNILLPFEQGANPIIAGDSKLVHMKYFFTRKLMFVKECDAVVCLPGGFGTLDEVLEVLTLLQTGKRDLVPVVLLDAPGGSYWKAFVEFMQQNLLGGGMISPEDQHLYLLTDSCRDAVEEVLNFYRLYHSMRYVKELLVLRLQHSLSEAQLDFLNQNYLDLVTAGEYRMTTALPSESDEPELNDMPRLVFQFNRRNHGRLRTLINQINSWSADLRV